MAAPSVAGESRPLTALTAAPPKQVVAAGNAVVAAAKVGRIVGRSYLRLARQLPGAKLVGREAARLTTVLADARRALDVPRAVYANADEERVLLLVHNTGPDADPLRSAMSELLHRSQQGSGSREYLFGSIVSQLVPDEAQIIATLATGPFPAADVVAKPMGRSEARVVFANASTVGRAASVTAPDDTPTYLTRLHRFNLIEFGPADDGLGTEYERITVDPAVLRAKAAAEVARQGIVRVRRKTVALSPLGREFWAATAPSPS